MDDDRWKWQIRSYVLLPDCRLVKDLRTSHETADVAAVLDGNIQPFLEAALPFWQPRFPVRGRAVLE